MSKTDKDTIGFTFEERQSCPSEDWDVYIYAGVSTESDCDIFGGPPAGVVCPNSLGLHVLSIRAKEEINHRLQTQSVEDVKAYIEGFKKEREE